MDKVNVNDISLDQDESLEIIVEGIPEIVADDYLNINEREDDSSEIRIYMKKLCCELPRKIESEIGKINHFCLASIAEIKLKVDTQLAAIQSRTLLLESDFEVFKNDTRKKEMNNGYIKKAALTFILKDKDYDEG